MRTFRRFPYPKLLRKRTVLSSLIAVALGAVAQEARAADYTWGNTGTDFNTNANWSPATGFPLTTLDNAVFASAATVQPVLANVLSINELNFSTATSTGYTLSATGGATLTLNSVGNTSTTSAISSIQATATTNTISAPLILGGAAASTQTFFNNVAGANLVVSGPISEANAGVKLQFLGAGSFDISNASNSYTGNTIIGNGTTATIVKMSNAAAFGTAATTVTINTNSLLQLPGGIAVGSAKSLVINGGNSIAFTSAGTNSWAGTITANTLLSRIESSSGTLTITGNITNNVSGANSLVIQGNGATTISGVISGVGSLTRSSSGTGVVTLSGANTYSGVTTISNGTLSVSSLNNVASPLTSSSLGRPTTVAAGTINIGSTGATGILKYTGTGETTDRVINMTTDVNSTTLDQSGSGLLKFTSNFTAGTSGAKTLTLTGAGNGEIAGAIPNFAGAGSATVVSVNKTGAGTWTLSGANSNSGTYTAGVGTLRVTNAAALGFGSLSTVSAPTAGTSVTAGATLDLANVTMQEVITLNGTGVGGNGALINSSASPTSIGSGLASLIMSNSGSAYSAPPTVTIGGPGSGAVATAFLGVTAATFGVTTGGTGYTAGNAVVTISGGGGTGATATAIISGGAITGFTITNAGSGYTSAPSIAVAGGTGATFTSNATNFIVSGVRTTTAGSGYTSAPTITFSSGVAAATANLTRVVLGSDSSIGGTGDITIDGNISGGFALTKVGANLLNLTAANTYTGQTTVSAGTLTVNNTAGSGTGTAAVLVNSSGTLAGNGFISGAVNVTGGTLAPGNSIDSLDTGTLSFTGGTFAAEINTTASTSDLVNVTGDLNLASNPTLSLTDLGGNVALTAGTVLTLVDYSGTWNSGIFAGRADDSTFAFGANTFKIDYNDPNFGGTALTLTVQAIPEPSTFVLGGLALLGFAGVGLRRRRAAKN